MSEQGENVNPVSMHELRSHKLEDLAEKSANKNGGSTAHYISANQALRDDLVDFLKSNFEYLHKQIAELKEEVKESRAKEAELTQEIKSLRSQCISSKPPSKHDVYMVGSSILREVKSGDLKNGYVKSISGGKIKDIKEKIANLQFTPKTIITLAGGNDIDSDIEIEKVVSEYSVTLTETKTKFPDVKLVVAGLPPRHHSNEMRTKTKDYNEAMKKWCQVNNVSFIDNETLFEYRSGEVDTSSFVMSGVTPAVHLTRPATIRMLKNIQQAVPELMLADLQHQGHSYADVLKKTPAEMRPNHENKDNRNRQPT